MKFVFRVKEVLLQMKINYTRVYYWISHYSKDKTGAVIKIILRGSRYPRIKQFTKFLVLRSSKSKRKKSLMKKSEGDLEISF